MSKVKFRPQGRCTGVLQDCPEAGERGWPIGTRGERWPRPFPWSPAPSLSPAPPGAPPLPPRAPGGEECRPPARSASLRLPGTGPWAPCAAGAEACGPSPRPSGGVCVCVRRGRRWAAGRPGPEARGPGPQAGAPPPPPPRRAPSASLRETGSPLPAAGWAEGGSGRRAPGLGTPRGCGSDSGTGR